MKSPSFRQQFRDLCLLTLTVLLFNLSFPGGSHPWLAWLTLVPLGVVVHQKMPGYALRVSICCALLCWLAATWWVIPGVSGVAESSPLVVVPFVLLFCLAYAVPYGLAAMLYSHFGWTSSVSGAVKAAFLWTAICFSVPHILPGTLAHSQYLYPRMIQVVELAGVPVLFFFLHLSNFLCVTAIVNWSKQKRYALQAIVIAVSIPVVLTAYGQWRITELHAFKNSDKQTSLRVGMVQPNVSIRSRQRDDWLRESVRMLALTEGLIKSDAALELIVWPEIPPPLSYVQQAQDRKLLDLIIDYGKIPMLIAGYQTLSHGSGSVASGYFNVAEFIPTSREAGVYRKQKLLPFGEYLPYEDQFPWLRRLFPNALAYLPGSDNTPFVLNEKIRLLPLICYEVVFSELVEKGIEQGGNLIVNPVDDAWFGKSKAAEIHLALALFRAVEFRLPIVRASNSGRSLLIDFTGEIVPESQIGFFKDGYAAGTVSVADIDTPYQKFSASFLWTVRVLTLICVVGCLLRDPDRHRL